MRRAALLALLLALALPVPGAVGFAYDVEREAPVGAAWPLLLEGSPGDVVDVTILDLDSRVVYTTTVTLEGGASVRLVPPVPEARGTYLLVILARDAAGNVTADRTEILHAVCDDACVAARVRADAAADRAVEAAAAGVRDLGAAAVAAVALALLEAQRWQAVRELRRRRGETGPWRAALGRGLARVLRRPRPYLVSADLPPTDPALLADADRQGALDRMAAIGATLQRALAPERRAPGLVRGDELRGAIAGLRAAYRDWRAAVQVLRGMGPLPQVRHANGWIPRLALALQGGARPQARVLPPPPPPDWQPTTLPLDAPSEVPP